MKQKFLLLAMIMLVASQGFAQHDGSWSILPRQIDYRENLGSDNNDGPNHSEPTGCWGFDGIVSVTDLVTPQNTTGATSSTSSGYISILPYYDHTFYVDTPLDKSQIPVKLNDPTGMFLITSTCYLGTGTYRYKQDKKTRTQTYHKWRIEVMYDPIEAGSHNATLTLYECSYGKNGIDLKTTNYTLSGLLTVAIPPIPIAINPNSLDFYKADSKTFRVESSYLKRDLTLRITGNGKRYFSLNKLIINKNDAKQGVYVKVSCNPTSTLSTASAKVEILYNGKVIGTVSLTYDKNLILSTSSVPIPEDESEDEEGAEKENEEVNAVEASQEVWSNGITSVDEVSMAVKVYADDQNIVIESPVAQSAVISDIAGRAQRVALQEGLNVVPASGIGIHIVRVGEKTVKLMLR